MAVVGFVRLLAIESEGLQDGSILYREQDGVLMGIIRMLMPGPRWYDEEIAGLPSEVHAVNDRITLSLEDVIDSAIRLPMCFGVHA